MDLMNSNNRQETEKPLERSKPSSNRHINVKNINFGFGKNFDQDEKEGEHQFKPVKFYKANADSHNRKSQNYVIKRPNANVDSSKPISLAEATSIKNHALEKEEVGASKSTGYAVTEEAKKENVRVIEVVKPKKIETQDNPQFNPKVKHEDGDLIQTEVTISRLSNQSKIPSKSHKSLINLSNLGKTVSAPGNEKQTIRGLNSTTQFPITTLDEIPKTNSNEEAYGKRSVQFAMNNFNQNIHNVNNQFGEIKLNYTIEELYPVGSKLLTFNMNDLKIIKEINETNYGKSYLVSDKFNNSFSILKYYSNSNQQVELIFQQLSMANTLYHEFLQRSYAVCINQPDKTSYCVNILQENFLYSLEDHIQTLKEANDFYQEEELIMILKSIVIALDYLQHNKGSCHGSISPSNILFYSNSDDTLGIKLSMPQLVDPLTAPLNLAFQRKFLIETMKRNELLLSPIMYSCYTKNKFDVKQHDPCKSDVFSLGMTMIYAATLCTKPLFLARARIDSDSIKKILEKHIKHKYSHQFVDLISGMVTLEERRRLTYPIILERLEAILSSK